MLVKLVKAYAQLRQWHTKRKIVVFESDDWGSIRMPSVSAYKKLVDIFPDIQKDHYSHYDSLENAEDLAYLFDVLNNHKDANGNHPLITANSIMANPDFKKIKEASFQKYFYEPFYTTLANQADGKQVLELWKQGLESKLFRPQFHGREHLLVPVWMYELQQGNELLQKAFNEGVYSVPVNSIMYPKRNNLQAAFDYSKMDDNCIWQTSAIKEGTKIFKDYFGFASSSFIATAYIWNEEIEPILKQCGVQYLQGLPVQYEPSSNGRTFNKKIHYTGQKNNSGQIYLTRNAFFEPSSNTSFDWKGECMRRIDKEFERNNPAIVGVHRVNFIGSLSPANRQTNLQLFNELLATITTKWPEVEFMSSDQLGDLIAADAQ